MFMTVIATDKYINTTRKGGVKARHSYKYALQILPRGPPRKITNVIKFVYILYLVSEIKLEDLH